MGSFYKGAVQVTPGFNWMLSQPGLQLPQGTQFNAQGYPITPAAPAPAAPPPPPPASEPSPWDAIYQQRQASVNKRRGNLEADYTQASSQLGQNYGLSYDPVSGAVALDPSNPYSKMALLKQSYDNRVRGSTNSMATQGQLYAGSLQNAQNENRRLSDVQTDSLKRGFMSTAQDLLRRRRDANQALDDELVTGRSDALDRAFQADLEMRKAGGGDPGPDPALPALAPTTAQYPSSWTPAYRKFFESHGGWAGYKARQRKRR